MTHLTLHLDDDVVLRAEAYAARTGKSLADLVAVYVIELTRASAVLTARGQVEATRDLPTEEDTLPQRQYRLARRYPGEYVVLVGERVVHHGPEREEAGRAYKQAFADCPSSTPVMVDPNRLRQRRPIVRGRALNKRRQA
jgi:hypothetical protein